MIGTKMYSLPRPPTSSCPPSGPSACGDVKGLARPPTRASVPVHSSSSKGGAGAAVAKLVSTGGAGYSAGVRVCVCMCACVCARARVYVCVSACAGVCVWMGGVSWLLACLDGMG